MVSLAVNTIGDSLPPFHPEGDWITLPDSPIPAALRAFLGGVYGLVEPVDADAPVDPRAWLDPATAPIDNVRLSLRDLGFPSGDYVGPVFERRVAARPLAYYRRRNTASMLMELADDAEFRYIIRWTPASGGPRTGANVLVTPTALLNDSTGWAEHLVRWLNWSYPLLAGAFTVTVAPEVRIALRASMAVIPVYGGIVYYA